MPKPSLRQYGSGDLVDYVSAVEACPSAIVITDVSKPDQPIAYVNPAFVDLTGYSPSDVIGENCRFLQGPKTDPKTVRRLHAAIGAGQHIQTEILNYRNDGQELWTDLSISPTRSADGAVRGFVGVLTDITARKQAESASSEAELRLSNIVKNMPGFVFQRALKPDGTILFRDSSLRSVTRDARIGELIGSSEWEAIHPDDRKRVEQGIAQSIADVAPVTLEFRVTGPHGREAWFRTSSTPRRMENGDVVWDGVGIDITQEKSSEARLSGIVDNMPGYIFNRVRKPDGTIEFPYFSPSFSRLIGHPEGEVTTGDDLFKLMHPEDIEETRLGYERSARDMSQLMAESRLMATNGDERWIRSYSTPRSLANGDVLWDGVGVDVTAEKVIELQLAYIAHHDPLTGLANRVLLSERLAAAIGVARTRRLPLAFSHVVLADFSEITETLGINESDAVLQGTAARMDELALLDRDSLACHFGGAEFAILRSGRGSASDADEFATIMMRSLNQPILIGSEPLIFEPCFGTAILRPDELLDLSAEAAAAELMKRAAIAMSAASRTGTGTYRLYDEGLDHRTQHRMRLRHSMRAAIEQDQFVLHYQPLVDLQSSRIVSAEALVRWQHPEFGLLRPDLFISLAEESGLIGLLGEWVMRTAMRQTKAWASAGFDSPRIALNVSSVQIRMPDFIESVKRTLELTGADASRFDLELTEGVLLEKSQAALSVLAELKRLGFQLVIDDFGAGHSSLQYLRNFPIDKLKIDQVFVRQLAADSSDAIIIRAIATLAENLHIGLVGEGIETAEQRDFLRKNGCAIGQGYFFSMPLTAEDFGWMIEQEVVLPIRPATI